MAKFMVIELVSQVFTREIEACSAEEAETALFLDKRDGIFPLLKEQTVKVFSYQMKNKSFKEVDDGVCCDNCCRNNCEGHY